MYTESEAKEKWCPQMIPTDLVVATCCASDCMAWRWNGFRNSWGGEGGATFIQENIGYCGLAGKP